MRFESEVIIYRNGSTVFDHLVDPEKLSHWVEDFVISTPVSELASRGRYKQVFRIGGSDQEMNGEVLEYIKDQKFAFTLEAYASQVTVTFELAPHDGGLATHLRCIEVITSKNRLAELILPILILCLRKKYHADVARLKRFLDGGLLIV